MQQVQTCCISLMQVMKAEYTIDLGSMSLGIIRFKAIFSAYPAGTALVLPALLAKRGVGTEDLSVFTPGKKRLRAGIAGEKIYIRARAFALEYTLRISLKECVGTDKGPELLYPFINASEVFLGSGSLPYPESLPRLAAGLRAELRITGLPAGWETFSSLTEDRVSPGSLDSFFLYCSEKRAPLRHTFKGLAGKIDLRLLVQKGKRIPLSASAVWKHVDHVMGELEKGFGPYCGANSVNILLLQPPADFERIMDGATFAAGENVLGGVAIYTPKSRKYLKKRFGHTSYARHLYDGLAHELTHFYSTTAWQGRYKSLLFPAAACPEPHKQLIGEIMTSYFHNGIFRRHTGKERSFISGKVLAQLSAWKSSPRKKPFLDLFLLDLWLRSKRSSLRAATAWMMGAYGRLHRPYRSASALLLAAENCAGTALPSRLRKTILSAYAPDYEAELGGFPGWDNKRFNPLRG